MPKFNVTIGSSETNVRCESAKKAIGRAVEKIWGRGYGFHVSSDQYYSDPLKATLYGVITKAAKGGGAHVITRTSISVNQLG